MILFCKHIDFNDRILIEVYLITLLCSHTHCVLMNRYTLITVGLRVGICFSRSVFYQIWMIRFRKCLLCIYCYLKYNIRVNIVTCPHIWTVTGIKQKFNALGDTYITLSYILMVHILYVSYMPSLIIIIKNHQEQTVHFYLINVNEL